MYPTFGFWSNFDPNLPLEDAQNQKQPPGYPNKSKLRPYFHSIFNENYNYFFLHLGFFRVQMSNGPRVKNQEVTT